ncbi:MAG: NADH-quinone oxidoreductase subunit H [Marinilabiliaceae bacterium]|nr:NADH-quinone oxidoreductase subunit H [Marinilabiliaceae bacterium]
MSFILILLASFFFTGIVIRVKSIAQGRKGPSLWQPMYDIWKLLHKGSVYSNVSSWIFKVAPTIYFATVIVAMLVVPVGLFGSVIGFSGDFIFFAYALALGKFFTIIGALDTASSFEGMGSAREALFSMLVEPAFFILIGSLGLLTGYTSFSDIFAAFHITGEVSYAYAAIAAFVLLMICMIENSRMPVDDPKTHLELTMIHEVMVLDNSGVDMGLIHQATNMKFALYTTLIAGLFIGNVETWWMQTILFFGIQVISAMCVGLIESFMARYRMIHNAQFILVLSSLALLIFFGIK